MLDPRTAGFLMYSHQKFLADSILAPGGPINWIVSLSILILQWLSQEGLKTIIGLIGHPITLAPRLHQGNNIVWGKKA